MNNETTQKQLGLKRKCGCCGEYFYINKNNIDEAIYYDKKTYHSSCFIEMCKKNSQKKRKDVVAKWTRILESYSELQTESRQRFINELTKDEIFLFIQQAYDITVVPTTVWHKLGYIYNGTFKGMSRGIPPEHLLDMWKQKINSLNRLAQRNTIKGKEMSIEQRIKYDLSVLINKYNNYLKWLEKQKILEAEKQEKQNDMLVTSIGLVNSIHNRIKEENTNTDNISNLVDDIFG